MVHNPFVAMPMAEARTLFLVLGKCYPQYHCRKRSWARMTASYIIVRWRCKEARMNRYNGCFIVMCQDKCILCDQRDEAAGKRQLISAHDTNISTLLPLLFFLLLFFVSSGGSSLQMNKQHRYSSSLGGAANKERILEVFALCISFLWILFSTSGSTSEKGRVCSAKWIIRNMRMIYLQ